MTNLNKEREEIIYELLLSLNSGASCYADTRVETAIAQYNSLVENKIITEWCEHDWIPEEYEFNESRSAINKKYKCSKCGEIKMMVHPFNI